MNIMTNNKYEKLRIWVFQTGANILNTSAACIFCKQATDSFEILVPTYQPTFTSYPKTVSLIFMDVTNSNLKYL